MSRSSKCMISTTHDQSSDVIYKIQNCNHHHHHHRYYHNDLFYRFNMKNKKNKRHKGRIPNRSRLKTKYSKNNKSNFNRNCSGTYTVTSPCYCVIYDKCYTVNFKISHQIDIYLQQISSYIRKRLCYLSYLQSVIVLVLLTFLITTAHSVDMQGKTQQHLTPSSSLITSFNDVASEAIIYLNKSLINTTCQFVSNALLCAKLESNLKAKLVTCRQYLDVRRHVPLHIRKHLNNLSLYNQLTSKCLAFNTRKKFKTNSYNKLNRTKIHYQHLDDELHYYVNATTVISKPQTTHKHKNTNLIKFENKMMEEDEKQHLAKFNSTNIHVFLKNIQKNKYKNNETYNSYNNTATATITTSEKASKETRKENLNDIIADHIDSDVNDFYDNNNNNNERVEIENFETSLISFQPATTIITTNTTANHSLHLVHKQQHIEHMKLMKSVMDGLGLKRVPNMETANISQEEYVTKFREYLQRVHLRKRGYDGQFFRPLEILSVVSNSTLLRQQPDVYHSYKENARRRQKRNAMGLNTEEPRKPNIEERVRNILFLRKKYQRPRSLKKQKDERKTKVRLMFALKPEILNLSSSDIEEANIRLVLIHSPLLAMKNNKNKKTHTKPRGGNTCRSSKSEVQRNRHQVNVINLKLYYISRRAKRVLLHGLKINIQIDHSKPDETHTQWIQFDVSKAIKMSIDAKDQGHVILELQCDNCKRMGARILNDGYDTAADALADDSAIEGNHLMPVLNIIGHFDQSRHSVRPHKHETASTKTNEEATTQRLYHHQAYNNNKNRHNRRTNCYKANQRCCRHSMEVTFKEIKGFEFIIQPKVFDAGYCHGRCPPRYNPAHHHALLQSLIWKQNHHDIPRPCCAPSKLVELEVLHVDEKDSEKLKISTWSDMKVVECACS